MGPNLTADARLYDTDVVVDYLRGNAQALAHIDAHHGVLLLSAMTVAELYVCVRENERAALADFVATAEVVSIDARIAERGGYFRQRYGPKHGTGIVDGIIAASAESLRASLVTLNQKHYPMLRDVVVPYRKQKRQLP